VSIVILQSRRDLIIIIIIVSVEDKICIFMCGRVSNNFESRSRKNEIIVLINRRYII
jgi:hypothetical protein